MPDQSDAPVAPVVIHPGDLIQIADKSSRHGVIVMVDECHSWGLGCANIVALGNTDGPARNYVRVTRDTPLAIVGTALIMPPEVEAARRASIAHHREVAAEGKQG